MEKCEALATSTTLPRSHQLLSAIVVNNSALLKKCGATWLHNRCVWTGNKLPDTTKIQVKLETIATAVRQRKSEISGYDVVPICSLMTLLIYILILSTYCVIQPITDRGYKWFPLELLDLNTAHYPPQGFCRLTTF
jgi:hypothetical protein